MAENGTDCWRMVTYNGKVKDLFESDSTTYTNNPIFFYDTLGECFNKIDELSIYHEYISGETTTIIFSGGSRTIIQE